MKKRIIAALLIAAFTLCFAACGNDEGEHDINNAANNVEYMLADYLKAPSAEVAASVVVDVAAIYADTSLSAAEKAAKMADAATTNEILCNQFTYFNSKIGTTNLGTKSGTLVYQRLRRQNLNGKFDITIKKPINHTFDAISAMFVTDAKIRCVDGGKYYKLSNESDIVYDDAKGLLTVAEWGRSDKWATDEDISASQNYAEARKTCVNFMCDNIIKDEGATVERLETVDGDGYYKLTFEIDTDFANFDATTIEQLENDNGGSNMSIKSCKFVIEIWECGLVKLYDISESWQGKIKIYEGAADSVSKIYYSYSAADNSTEGVMSIVNNLK